MGRGPHPVERINCSKYGASRKGAAETIIEGCIRNLIYERALIMPMAVSVAW